jgi:hypothetical protein
MAPIVGIGLGLRRWALFSSFDLLSARIKHISVSGQYSKIYWRFL